MINERFRSECPPKNVALSWFKDSATPHISRTHKLPTILNNYGLQTEILINERPGYIVYEDEFQVVAEPFAVILA